MSNDKEINVRVVTTSGNYPEHGHEKVPASEAVAEILKRAAKKLEIADVTGWVAKVKDDVVNTSSSYAALGLKGEVKIDFGPNEGGGG